MKFLSRPVTVAIACASLLLLALAGLIFFANLSTPVSFLATVSASAFGYLLYLRVSAGSTPPRWAARGLAVVVVTAGLLFLLCEAIAWDPVGDTWDSGILSTCSVQEIRSIASADGRFVAAVRGEGCSGGLLAGEADVVYFVFVRKMGETNNRSNLVFRYESFGATEPEVAWAGNRVIISVGDRGLIEVTKQRRQAENFQVEYDLRGAVHTALRTEWWQPR